MTTRPSRRNRAPRKNSKTSRRKRRRPSPIGEGFDLRLGYLEEPLLEIGFGQKRAYPRDGLFLYGPFGDETRLREVRYGVIGTPDGVRRLREWTDSVRGFIDIPEPGPRSKAVEAHHVAFPGFTEAFQAEWPREPTHTISDLDGRRLAEVLRRRNRHEAIHAAVDLYVERLIAENNRIEDPPALWFVVIPEIVYQLGRPRSSVPRKDQTEGSITVT